MATMMKGVVIERKNTIEENRQILIDLMKKNEFFEPSHKELTKLFTRLNADNAKELVKDMESNDRDWQGKKVTDRPYGPLPGIPCGSWWGIRMDCSRDRMHDPFSASVQCGPVGAVSICTSHSNEDVDLGDMLTFTDNLYADENREKEGDGEGSSSRSLVLNYLNRVPVRIIRSYNISNEYSPKTGYRYDGLYAIVDYWIGVTPKNNSRCYKFALKRLFHQEPPPWKLKKPRNDSEPLSLSRHSKNFNSLLSRGGKASIKNNDAGNTNDTIISRCISSKRFHTRDRNTLAVIKSPRKRRSIKQHETSVEPEGVQSTSGSKESTITPTTTLPASPGRKIVSTDHRNVHISAIVTRRVSKKLSTSNNIDNKLLLNDCGINKSWNFTGGIESQVINSDGDDEGVQKSQNCRLQNTNISIRTDLYDSSHNLKCNTKKSAANVNHSLGIFKPRILGVPRRELNFAGVDSSPGSSRAISSVKMERVNSIDNQINKKSFNQILYREKEKEKEKTQENQRIIKNPDIIESSPISRTFSPQIDREYARNEDFGSLEIAKSNCLNNFEHSYASELPKSSTRNENYRNSFSEVINREEDAKKPKEFSNTRVAGSVTPVRELSPVVSSPSQSPFKGFQCSERSKNGAESSLSDPSMMMNSLTFEKMLDIIAEDKSSPMAKMLISNVIGFPADGISPVFKEPMKTGEQIRSLESRGGCDTEKRPPVMKTKPSDQQAVLNHQTLGESNQSRKLKPFENSRQQKIIEIVYEGEEEDLIQESRNENCDSLTSESSFTAASKKILQKAEEVCLRLCGDPENDGKKETRVSGMEDTVDFWAPGNKRIERFAGNYETDKISERGKTRLTITRGEKDRNSRKRHDSVLNSKGELVKPDIQSISMSSASQIGKETLKTQALSPARIITRSKCLRNSIRGGDTNSESLRQEVDTKFSTNIARNRDADCNQNLEGGEISVEKSSNTSGINSGLRSSGKVEQSDDKIVENKTRSIPKTLEGENLPNREERGSKSERSDGGLSKGESAEKIRLIKRSGVRMKRKMEVANLFIDMNMSPRSQKFKVKPRSRRRSLRGANHSRRRSCPAVIDRAMKRRNEDPVKHPASPLKRMKKSVQVKVQSSSVQGAAAAAKKGLSIRNRTKNDASPSRNNINNNNNDRDDKNSCVKKIVVKAGKVINKITKPIKTASTRNLVAKKNTVTGLRATAEISKRREAMTRTRSGLNPRSLTVGRLGLRRALLTGTETYGRKKKKRKEKQRQTVEKIEKQKKPEKEMIGFSLKKAKLDYQSYRETKEPEKRKMVSVMTQCSLIPVPPQCSPAIIASYCNRASIESNSHENAGYLRGTECVDTEYVCSSHNSAMDQMKDEIIELVEIKSEAIDDDVANYDDEDVETDEIRVQSSTNSAINRLKDRQTSGTLDKLNIERSEVRGKSLTPSLHRFSRNLGTSNDQISRDSASRKGFVPYVSIRRRASVFVPVRSVEGDLRMAQLKSIGFKPIKPGSFPPDGGFEDGSEYGRRSTSDSPRISYSSGVIKRGVNEEYDKYTSEENNVVQYMDSKLCYEDIENEDVILYCNKYNKKQNLNDLFHEKMEFVKFGETEIDEESNDDDFLLRVRDDDEEEEGKEEEEAEEVEEYETEEFEKEDIKDWQSQLDEKSTSNSENYEQASADSDGDVPWHGWKKITSNKETYFVGW